jgi:hypothetical protein
LQHVPPPMTCKSGMLARVDKMNRRYNAKSSAMRTRTGATRLNPSRPVGSGCGVIEAIS